MVPVTTNGLPYGTGFGVNTGVVVGASVLNVLSGPNLLPSLFSATRRKW